MEYELHFGKSYPYHLGYDKKYHRIIYFNNYNKAQKFLNRVNNCKWIEWTDLIKTNKGTTK